MARYLSARGFHVFAGCRKPADASGLVDEPQRLTPLMLDVTDGDSIAGAFETVSRTVGEAGLFASFDEGAAEPQEVSEAVFEALTVESPQTRYLVGEAAHEVAGLLSMSDEARDEVFMKMWEQASLIT